MLETGRFCQVFFLILVSTGGHIGSNLAQAQVTPDATLGSEASRVTPNQVLRGQQGDRIEGGARRGSALFHSFREFNIGNGQRVYFANPAGVQAIFSRVTGSSPSALLGTLGVLGNANLFLLNPNGVLFGPNARLDIAGSFVASTADRLTFADGQEFSATNPQAPPLLTVNLMPGIQLGASQANATITNQGSLQTGADLMLQADRLELWGTLQAGDNLQLAAQDTVQIRDRVTQPFLARATGDLTIQGDRAIDIWALNHPAHTPLVSSGNLTLISDGVISTDAHFESGGDLRLRTRSGTPANFLSLNDPVFNIGGSYEAGSYAGASLQVTAGGDIRFDRIEINALDPAVNPTNPAVVLRAGGAIVGTGEITTTLAGLLVDAASQGAINLQRINTNGGSIRLSSAQGSITNNGAELDLLNFSAPTPSNLTLTAAQDIDVGFVQALGNPGTIAMTSRNGQIRSGNILAISAGTVELTAATGIRLEGATTLAVGGRNGGAVRLTTARGDIETGTITTLGTEGNAGDVSLTAATGNILLATIDSPQPGVYADASRNGGRVTLSAPNGRIRSGGVIFTGSFGAGNGGAITAIAANGIEIVGSLLTGATGTAGNGGAVRLTTTSGNLNTGVIVTLAENGNGGAVELDTRNGSIRTERDIVTWSDTFNPTGRGGDITLSARNGGIDTGNLYAYSAGDRGRAGDITITSTGGNLAFGNLLAFSLTGTGGNIRLRSTNEIVTSSINATGNLGSGKIAIATDGDFATRLYLGTTSAVISSDTFGPGAGGDITIAARSIRLRDGAQVSASTHASGQGGNIRLQVSDRLDLSGVVPPTAQPGSFAPVGLTGILPGTYLGGYIPTGKLGAVDFTNAELPSGVFTQTTAASTGNAGTIRIAAGQVQMFDRARIGVTTFGAGTAGNIRLTATGSVNVANGGILSGVAPAAQGTSGGTIAIRARSLDVTQAGLIQTRTLGRGDAGQIQIETTDAVRLANPNSAIRSSSGGTGGGVGSGGGAAIGRGGDIRINTGSLTVTDNAVIDAQTQSGSPGGQIAIAADALTVAQGGRLLTTTFGQGVAGNITVQSPQIELSGATSGLFAQTNGAARAGNLTLEPGAASVLHIQFRDEARISAATTGTGQGGTLTVQAPGAILIQGQGAIAAGTTGSGQGGNLRLTAPEVTLRDRVQATVSGSANAGTAGNLTITADRLTLDTAGQVIAETQSGNGGNIAIAAAERVLLRRESLISTSAGTALAGGNGGNITIATPFAIGVLTENSDIRANAYTGNGGQVKINAQGIYGLQFQARPTPRSDITASSEFGFSGEVILNTLDLDPSRGLVELPSLVDPTNQIAQSCTPNREQSASQFIATGRGGLPPSPVDPLTPDATIAGWIDLADPANQTAHSPISALPTSIVEIDRWVKSPTGEIFLVGTAIAPPATPACAAMFPTGE
jgi:filamentous hemagglutinin family protein